MHYSHFYGRHGVVQLGWVVIGAVCLTVASVGEFTYDGQVFASDPLFSK